MNILKNKKGFTLIELIVVIAIIAILAAVLLPRFTGFSDNAKKKASLSDARNYAVAVQALIAEGGSTTFNAIAAPNNADETKVQNYLGTTFPGTFSITNANGSFTYTANNGFNASYDGATGVVSQP